MLTIENINIINSKFAGTPEWQIGEMFIGEENYVFQIHKRVGDWTIQGIPQASLTIRLHRIKAMDGYVMESGFVRQNYYARSVYSIENMKTINGFTMCLDNHIKRIIR
jgi:hypothetical protein